MVDTKQITKLMQTIIIPSVLGVGTSLLLFALYKHYYYVPSLLPTTRPQFISPKEQCLERTYLQAIKQKTEMAYTITSSLFKENQHKSFNEIKLMIKAALRNIRYGDNYFFIVQTDGTDELYPIMPHLENTNVLNLQDSKGKYVVQDEIKIAKTQGEGFVSGYWPLKSMNNQLVMKVSYIKLFSPLKWIIGYGEYTNQLEQKIKLEVRK